MFWPFKRTPVVSLEEIAATKPMPDCGEPVAHLTWNLDGMRCPMCVGIAERAKKLADEDRMAEKIAAALLRQITAQGAAHD